jgi:hypothetical protein
MKYLKSFNQINESEIWDIFTRQNKTYMDLDEDEYDYMMDDLQDIKGRQQITEGDKQKILRILNGYLKPEVTGIEFKGVTLRVPHAITLYYKTNCGIHPDFRINYYNDDYFVMQANVPVVFPKSISMVTLYYVIDGWDGFEEFAQKTTPYIGNEKIMSLLKSPLRELDSELEEIDHDKFLELCDKYPIIRDGELKTFYFFDGGKHIATVRYNPVKDYYLQNSRSLQYDKSYKEKLF